MNVGRREQARDIVPLAEKPHTVVDAERAGLRRQFGEIELLVRPLDATGDPARPAGFAAQASERFHQQIETFATLEAGDRDQHDVGFRHA